MSTQTLRIATLNVWALPFGIAKHVPERMAAIARRMGELELDVIGLQEVWTEEARNALIEGGRRAGLVHAWHRPEARGGSGLLLLSRLPLEDVSFHPFRVAGLPQRIHHGDYWGGKGFVTARVTLGGARVTVLNTHLHAQYTADPVDEYRGIRTAQAIQIAAVTREIQDPLVAMGDFNVRAGNPDHTVLVGLSGFRDAALALDNPQDTILAPHPYRGAGHRGGERIDYVFTRAGQAADAAARTIERSFDGALEFAGEAGTYSDHAGLRAEIAIEAGPPRGMPAADAEVIARAHRLLDRGRAEAERRRGIERSLALGSGALALAALPASRQLRASRRGFLASMLAGLGVACIPAAGVAGVLSEVAVPRELRAFDDVERMLDEFPASA